MNQFDVIIIGAGPAGLTAAIYTTRANLKTLVIAGGKWGGQLMLTTLVENFPGFPEGIQGPELLMNIRKQAENFGAEIIESEFTEGDFSRRPFSIKTGDGKTYTSKSIIIATGADARWLGVPGEQEKIGRGVSSCATCDSGFFRNKNVIVVGGGDSAMEEAMVLSHVANWVLLIHRRGSFRASQVMQDRVRKNPKIHIMFNSAITKVSGQFKVEKVEIATQPSDKTILKKTKEQIKKITPAMLHPTVLAVENDTVFWEMPVDGIFVAIGHIPNTKQLKGIATDEQGYIKVLDHFRTSVEGIFTAGDVHDKQYRQAIVAAGYGAAAALEAEKWLQLQK